MEGDSVGVQIPLLGFLDLILDKSKIGKIGNHMIFRLAESPATIIASGQLVKYLENNSPKDKWCIDITKLKVV